MVPTQLQIKCSGAFSLQIAEVRCLNTEQAVPNGKKPSNPWIEPD